jgi:hypothetical protein
LKIFISHSSYDKWVAEQISRLLTAEAHETFLDEKDIKTGDSIDTSIYRNLKDCDQLLLLVTPASLKSHWVSMELGGAQALDKHVVPITLHVGSNELPPFLANRRCRDINEFDKYLHELKVVVAATKGGRAASSAQLQPTTPEKAEVSKSHHKKMNGFSVGDEVRIAHVERLTNEDKAKSPKWVDTMDKFSGATTKITAFSPTGYAFLAVTADTYRWNLDWLTLAR